MSPRDSVLNLMVAFPVLYRESRGPDFFWFMERHIHVTVAVTGVDKDQAPPQRSKPLVHMDGQEAAIDYVCQRYVEMMADGWHLKRTESA